MLSCQEKELQIKNFPSQKKLTKIISEGVSLHAEFMRCEYSLIIFLSIAFGSDIIVLYAHTQNIIPMHIR